MKKYSISIIMFLCLLVSGCANSASSPESLESREARARQDFASNINQTYPFRVSFSAQGENKKILSITVLEEVAPYAASGTVDLIISDELKRDAKALKFTQIHIKGGRKRFTSPDTIDRKIPL